MYTKTQNVHGKLHLRFKQGILRFTVGQTKRTFSVAERYKIRELWEKRCWTIKELASKFHCNQRVIQREINSIYKLMESFGGETRYDVRYRICSACSELKSKMRGRPTTVTHPPTADYWHLNKYKKFSKRCKRLHLLQEEWYRNHSGAEE